ncbi:MAG TPA: acyl carrier protein [Noviherbaspirillum sp.]|nr:acyl carrier protein [Noviherbaspirillum sp.]
MMTSLTAHATHATLSARIVELLSLELKVPSIDIALDLPLTQYGLDSIAALTIAGTLEDELRLDLPSTLLWDCPTIQQLADYLVDVLSVGSPMTLAA